MGEWGGGASQQAQLAPPGAGPGLDSPGLRKPGGGGGREQNSWAPHQIHVTAQTFRRELRGSEGRSEGRGRTGSRASWVGWGPPTSPTAGGPRWRQSREENRKWEAAAAGPGLETGPGWRLDAGAHGAARSRPSRCLCLCLRTDRHTDGPVLGGEGSPCPRSREPTPPHPAQPVPPGPARHPTRGGVAGRGARGRGEGRGCGTARTHVTEPAPSKSWAPGPTSHLPPPPGRSPRSPGRPRLAGSPLRAAPPPASRGRGGRAGGWAGRDTHPHGSPKPGLAAGGRKQV